MCATMLLIVSLIGCVCYSCTILYKLREHSWAKQKYLATSRNENNHMDRHNEVERRIYSSTLSQGPTPPPIYTSTRAESWNEGESLVHN